MKHIIRLNLNGRISKDAYSNLSSYYGELEEKVFHLIIDDSNLKISINRDTIKKEFTEGSFPYEFLSGLEHDEEALQIAYELLRGE